MKAVTEDGNVRKITVKSGLQAQGKVQWLNHDAMTYLFHNWFIPPLLIIFFTIFVWRQLWFLFKDNTVFLFLPLFPISHTPKSFYGRAVLKKPVFFQKKKPTHWVFGFGCFRFFGGFSFKKNRDFIGFLTHDSYFKIALRYLRSNFGNQQGDLQTFIFRD